MESLNKTYKQLAFLPEKQISWPPQKPRMILLLFLVFSSFFFAGCEKGSLGVKNGAIQGYVLDGANNTPLADVLIRATSSAQGKTVREALTGGDGSYVLSDLVTDGQHEWEIVPQKFGWVASIPPGLKISVTVGNGETARAPLIFMAKTGATVKGTLRGYPIDSITGAPIQNFTVSKENPSRFKKFETAQEFKESGWIGLESGFTVFKITSENYDNFITPTLTTDPKAVVISETPFNLGVVKMTPLTLAISGTLRNLPGYILGDSTFNQNTKIWAESAGRIVATGTTQAIEGSAIYNLFGVPSSVGNVAVKCKVRGYDVITINPSVTIPKQRPSGMIAGIDADFATIKPIKRDVRVVVQGLAPADDKPSSFESGETARVYIRQGGKDIVPYVDVVGNNYMAEAYFSGVVTGYEIEFLVVNLTRGWLKGELPKEKIPEDGGTTYTVTVQLK
ncbi:carboxypeptidase regulatory-like domain-containing protein [bacterium]|nr:carboxypeptidase regulatory-like domain-containing protein [bacterium]